MVQVQHPLLVKMQTVQVNLKKYILSEKVNIKLCLYAARILSVVIFRQKDVEFQAFQSWQ
jgi:hypothetical protein